MARKHKITQNSTICGSCHTELIEQQCPNEKCTLYSYKPEVVGRKPIRELNEKEKLKGRSPFYYEMSGEEQWEEDKRLGILDWDGN